MDKTSRSRAGILPASPGALPEPHEDAPLNPEVRYEPSDASLRWVLVFAGSLIVFCGVVSVALLGLFWFLLAREPAVQLPPSVLAVRERGQFPPAPRLEGLVSYGKWSGPPPAAKPVPKYLWVDQKRKVISIPVDEAMDVYAKKLSAQKPEAGGGAGPPKPPPSSANSGRTVSGGQP